MIEEEDSSPDTVPTTSYNYRCKDCGKVFPNAMQLRHHYRMDHLEGL